MIKIINEDVELNDAMNDLKEFLFIDKFNKINNEYVGLTSIRCL